MDDKLQGLDDKIHGLDGKLHGLERNKAIGLLVCKQDSPPRMYVVVCSVVSCVTEKPCLYSLPLHSIVWILLWLLSRPMRVKEPQFFDQSQIILLNFFTTQFRHLALKARVFSLKLVYVIFILGLFRNIRLLAALLYKYVHQDYYLFINMYMLEQGGGLQLYEVNCKPDRRRRCMPNFWYNFVTS